MKRTIKFRVWNLKKRCFTMQSDDQRLDLTLRHYELTPHVEYPQQFIGISDMNKTDVYEGDNILIHWPNCDATSETISYDEKYGYWKYGNNPICELFDPLTNFEVIGNIYQPATP